MVLMSPIIVEGLQERSHTGVLPEEQHPRPVIKEDWMLEVLPKSESKESQSKRRGVLPLLGPDRRKQKYRDDQVYTNAGLRTSVACPSVALKNPRWLLIL